MEIVKAKKTDIDEIEKIYENIHDEEEAGRAAFTPRAKPRRTRWTEGICLC